MNTIVKPLPCFQKWEDMAPYEGGRLCGGCGKVVTDFRKKSWTEIEQTHIKSSFPVCGIYDDKQINFWGQQVLSKNNFLRSRKFFSAFFAFLYLSSPKIQLKAQPRQEIQSKQKETPSTPKPRIEKKRIIGTIVKQLNDSTKIPLENAVVYLYEDSLHKTKTDSLGRFILDISKKYNSLPKDLSLIVSHPDFPTKSFLVDKFNLHPFDILFNAAVVEAKRVPLISHSSAFYAAPPPPADSSKNKTTPKKSWWPWKK